MGYLALEALAASAFTPAYSYSENVISDLGVPAGEMAPGSHDACLMQAAFYLQGALFLLGALLIVGIPSNRRARLFLGLVAANAVGNVLVGTVHSGKLHVAGAALAILGGNVAILAGCGVIKTVGNHRWYRVSSAWIATLGVACLTMLVVNWATAQVNRLPDGVWERGSVYAITGWQLLTAGCLLLGHWRSRSSDRAEQR